MPSDDRSWALGMGARLLRRELGLVDRSTEHGSSRDGCENQGFSPLGCRLFVTLCELCASFRSFGRFSGADALQVPYRPAVELMRAPGHISAGSPSGFGRISAGPVSAPGGAQ